MIIELKPEDELLVQKRLQSGAFTSIEDIIHQALESLEADEAWLAENRETIHEKIAKGLAQMDRGEGFSADDSRTKLQKEKEAWLEQQRG